MIICLHPLSFDVPVGGGGPRRNINMETRMVGLPDPDGEKNFADMYNLLDSIAACDRQIDGQADISFIHSFVFISCHSIVHAMHMRRVLKTKHCYCKRENILHFQRFLNVSCLQYLFN